MDSFFSYDMLTLWLMDYGSITLFCLLALGIVAFPIPEETLMVFAGILMSTGKLPILYTILASLGGSMCGITMSYIIGRTAGNYFTHRYGQYIGLTEERLEKGHAWFEHYGKWSLFVGYFIPGVRHFTGVIAGTTGLATHQFMIFAYIGAFFWVSTFLAIGYFFGDYALVLYTKVAEFDLSADWIALGIMGVIGVVIVVLSLTHLKKK